MNKLTFAFIIITAILWVTAKPVGAQEWTLEACVEYAMRHNRELRASDREVQAIGLEEKTAKSALLPEITGMASMDHYWKIPVQVFPGELLGQPEGTFVPVRLGTPWMGNYGAEASFEIANPTTWQQIKLATLRSQMALGGHEAVERTLIRNVRMAHHVAALGRHSLLLVQSRTERLREIHQLIVQQHEQGVVDKIGLNQSRTLLNDLEASRKAAQASYHASLLDLKFWMGYPLDSALLVPVFREIPVTQVSADVFSPTALPEYGRHQSNLDLTLQEWRASRIALLPSLSLKAGYNRLGFGSSLDAMGRSDWFPSGYVGLQLRVPILSIGEMAYAPSKYRLRSEVAKLELSQYQEAESKRVIQERIALEKAVETMRIREENVALALENENLVFQKLEKGIIDMMELKQTQQEVDRANEALIEARLDYLRHHVELNYLQNNQ